MIKKITLNIITMKQFNNLAINQFNNRITHLFCGIVIFFIFLGFSASSTYAAIAVDDVSTNTGSGNIDVTHVVSGSNRLMLVGISTDYTAVAVSSVVWDSAG